MARIIINGISLDPIVHSPELEGLALSSPDATTSDYILIQVKGPISPQNRKELGELGVQLLEFVPENTYIARFEGHDLGPINRLDFVDWANVYLKGFKISPDLLETDVVEGVRLMAMATGDEPVGEGSQDVDIVFHAGVNSSDVVHEVAMAAGLDPDSLQVDSKKIRANIDRSRLSAVASIDKVRHIEEVFKATLSNDVAIQILRAHPVHHASPGLRGEDQIVAVCDTGFDKGVLNDVHSAFTGRVISLYPLGRHDKANDPHGHGTHVAGSVLGDGNAQNHGPVTGSAPSASLVLQSVYDSGGGLGGLPSDLNNLFKDPYDKDGARIHTNSWGTTGSAGRYTSYSGEVDEFIWNNRDLVICFAAGNPGRDSNSNGVIDLGSVQAPGTAKNCITVGASENDRINQSRRWSIGSWQIRYPVDPIANDLWADDPDGMAAFSGRGPTTDGRIKPDVVAPGTSIISAHSRDASVGDFWGTSPDPDYCYMGGTSMATPLVAGCAAVVREFLIRLRQTPKPSAALIKALLINGAVDLLGQYVPTEAGPAPNFSEGFGRVNLERSLLLDNPDNLMFWDEDQELETGESQSFNVSIPAGGGSLKATLVWTDYPGASLQNDLDLIVIRTSDNEEQHGNVVAGSSEFDRTNNVEQVLWENLEEGSFEVVVNAHRIPIYPQSFALVVRIE